MANRKSLAAVQAGNVQNLKSRFEQAMTDSKESQVSKQRPLTGIFDKSKGTRSPTAGLPHSLSLFPLPPVPLISLFPLVHPLIERLSFLRCHDWIRSDPIRCSGGIW